MISQETKDRLIAKARASTCRCGNHGLEMTFPLVARPIGSFSLAGQQMKASAREVPKLSCPACGAEAMAKGDNEELASDGKTG